MQKNPVLFLVIVFVCAALVNSVSGVLALGSSGLRSILNEQTLPQQYAVAGVIQAKNGNVWTIDGKDYTIDPLSLNGGPSNVGDSISLTVSIKRNKSVEQAAAIPSPTPSPKVDVPETAEITGVVSAIDAATITVGGIVYNLSTHSELQNVRVGDRVKLEFSTAANSSQGAPEIETSDSEDQSTGTKGQHENNDHHGSSGTNQDNHSNCHGEDEDSNQSGNSSTSCSSGHSSSEGGDN
jgi:hypothetical protein